MIVWVFNPTSQAMKFDPDGHHVRRRAPELVGLAAPSIHESHVTNGPEMDVSPGL